MSSRTQDRLPLSFLSPRVLSLSVLLVFASGANLHASTLERSDSEIRNDIAFARGLAAQWQFVDLAEGVLESLGDEDISAELSEELAMVRCSIFAEGAKNEVREEKRDELWVKAVQAYQDFLDEYELSRFAPEAERDYVDLANAYGLHLMGKLEEAAGAEATEIRDQIDSVLRDAVSRTGELVESMESTELTATQERAYHILLYNRAQLYMTLGKSAESGEYFYNQAEETLVKLAFAAGETSAMGMLAYTLMGELFAGKGDWVSSVDYYEFVVDAAVPKNADRWDAIREAQSRPQLQERWGFAERGVGGLVEAYANQEKYDKAAEWSLHFYNTYIREGYNLGTPHGYFSLLSVARTLLRTGGFLGGAPGELQWFATEEERDGAGFNRRQRQSAEGLALLIADQVNQDNRGNILQVQAQRLISELISNPTVSVPPDVLFEAAKGEQNARNDAEAVRAFKRVLAALALGDEQTQKLFASKVHYNIGRSLDRMGRSLEAAVAFREGVTTWRGDPEFDAKNADGFRQATAKLRRAEPDNDRLTQMSREAEDLVVQIGVGADDVLYNQALRVYNEKDYVAARAAFQRVPGSAGNYEKALTFAAVCAYKAGDVDGAEGEFVAYLEDFLNDPTNATTSEAKLTSRQEAKAQATYYLGELAYKSRKDYARVVELLADYDSKFPNQDSFAPAALYIAVRALLAQREFDRAEAIYKRMLESFPSSRFTGTVALDIYKKLDVEYKAAGKSGDTAKASTLLRKMAQNLQISNQLSTKPDFAKLRNESKHWIDLEEWETARSVLERISKNFADGKLDGAEQSDMENFVYPDLGHALLELRNAADALTYLDALVPDPDVSGGKKAASRTVLDYCRAVTGWVEGDASSFVEVPGVGDAAQIEKAAKWLNKISNSLEKWECEWYGVKFDMAYAYYKWGQLDSAKMSAAKSQVGTLRTELGNNLEGIKEACGDDVLRRRFLTLWDRIQ